MKRALQAMAIIGAVTSAANAEEMSARYAQASELLAATAGSLVSNDSVSPHWTGNGGEFWYTRQAGEGMETVLVSSDGVRAAAFDHVRLATALATTIGKPVKADALSVVSMVPGREVVIDNERQHLVCNLTDYRCAIPPAAAPKDPRLLPSPDGKRVLFARDHNLWIRELASGKERRLTTDGVDGDSWGEYTDSGLLSITRQRLGGLPFPPIGAYWSADGKRVIASRTDERGIAPTWFLEAVPQDGSFRTKVWPVRQPMTGDKPPSGQIVIIELASGRKTPLLDQQMAVDEPLAWSADGTRFVAVAQSDEGRTLNLVEVNAKTGAVRKIISERPKAWVNLNPLMYSASNVRTIRAGSEVLWYSERSGFGHLYRYRVADGKLLNSVTTGDWIVRDVLAVDEMRGRIVFSANGRDPADPYRRRIYRVNFDGSDLQLLTPEAADHQIDGPPNPMAVRLGVGGAVPQFVSPDGTVFVDTWSTVDTLPVSVLRSTEDGRVLAQLERADASKLYATGWEPPKAFVAKSADGVTDLYGVLYLPKGATHAATKSVPLVDAIYGGPQFVNTPHNFTEAWRSDIGPGPGSPSATRALGFATFVLDGRGTPLRANAFRNASFTPSFADAELADHVAVAKQLVADHPFLDPTRIGIYGHSFGGYVSARAMLLYPDVFKVGVSTAGIHSVQTTYAGISDSLPAPVYANGKSIRPTPQSVPENYRAMDNATLAGNLHGKLLLVYGDLDENAPFAGTAHLIDALIKADRRFDLLYLPNRQHSLAGEPYVIRRIWDYFVEHLMSAQPPAR